MKRGRRLNDSPRAISSATEWLNEFAIGKQLTADQANHFYKIYKAASRWSAICGSYHETGWYNILIPKQVSRLEKAGGLAAAYPEAYLWGGNSSYLEYFITVSS